MNSNLTMFVDAQPSRDDVIIDLPHPDALVVPVAEEDLAAVALLALNIPTVA